MKQEQWNRADELFDRALDLDGDQRATFLRAECGDDEDLRALVSRLLAAADSDTALPEHPDELLDATTRVEHRRPASGGERSGDRLGPWELIRPLGIGGMAEVYLGRRADGAFEQEAAVKILSRAPARELVERFHRERQILAGFEHPHIARLLDGGTTGDGRPFLVMELVDGLSLDRYCDEHRLSIRQRIQLFLDVISAVEAAHRRLVIHRDLKPGNVLVNRDGQVKLLDFGIAKLLDEQEEGGGATRIMTPAYASPEQVRGEAVTTATDVYQLGLVLYRLLAGELPYDTDSGLLSAARAVAEEEPLRPFRAVEQTRPGSDTPEERAQRRSTTVPRLRRDLRGDLETILLRALRKEPERRYATAAALASDLRRFLAHRPISARSDARLYRATRFLQRHALASALTGVMLLLIVGFAVSMAVQARRLQMERDRASLEARTANQVVDFLTTIFAVADPSSSRGREISALEVLERGRRAIEDELVDRPDLRFRLLGSLSEVHRNLGVYDEALRLAEDAAENARAAHGENSREAMRADVRVADLQAADSAELEQPLKDLNRLLGAWEGRLREDDPDLLALHDARHRILSRQGRFQEALKDRRRTLALRAQRFGEQDRSTLEAAIELGAYAAEAGQIAEAEEVFARTLERARVSLGEDDPITLRARSELARHWNLQGLWDRSEELYRRAISDLTRVLGEDHPQTLAARSNLGTVLRVLERYEESERELRETAALFESALGPDAGATLATRMNLGLVLTRLGRYQEAEREYLTVLRRQESGGLDLDAHITRSNLANLYRHQERKDDARALLLELVDEGREVLGRDHPSTLLSLFNAACFLAAEGDLELALDLLAEAAEDGFTHRAIFEDPEIDPLRGRSEFAAILHRVEENRRAVGVPPRP